MSKISQKESSPLVASIIIPTFNRIEILQRVLQSLDHQTISGESFEIIVSDDCSIDGTRDYLAHYKRRNSNPFKVVLADRNGGPARARNLALGEVVGDIIVIIGDDIVVENNFLEKHLQWHTKNHQIDYAVLGYVSWPDSIKPSAFMTWLYEGGRDYFFNYGSFKSGEQVDCQNFYTCNVSIKREMLGSELFDESFPYASHEDLELGERLGRNGMKLFYSSDILGHHHHFLKIEGIAKRVYLMGRSAHIFWQKVPDDSSILKKTLRNVLKTCASIPGIYSCLLLLLRIRENENKNYPFRWKLILTMCYWLGLADAQNDKNVRTFQENWS